MRSTQQYTIANSFAGFRRFLKEDIFYIKNEINTFNPIFYDVEARVTRYIQATYFKELYEVFKCALNEEELKCVDYFMSSCPSKVMPDNFKYHFESAYKVWKRIFFSGAYRGIKDIDSHLLGIGMRTIRKINGASITLVANILGVDRTTLSHFENGKRIPPLNFLFKFCTLLNYSIEDLLNACIK